MRHKRAFLAALFAIIYPGLGHLYLREWLRAVSWFVIALFVAAIVVPESMLTAFEAGGLSSLVEVTNQLPTESFLALFVVRVLNVVDAVWIALRAQQKTTPENQCPQCGQELDEDLDFCPWCTTRFTDDAVTSQ